jgi:hypothetical protein
LTKSFDDDFSLILRPCTEAVKSLSKLESYDNKMGKMALGKAAKSIEKIESSYGISF